MFCSDCGIFLYGVISHECSVSFDMRKQQRYEIASKLFIKYSFEGDDQIPHDAAAREFIEAADIFLEELEKTEVKSE